MYKRQEQWAAAVNTKFEEKGLDVRIDHRSYVRQGLDLIPTVHEGANVRQMEAKGIRTEKGELNRWIKATNRLMQDVRKKIKALFVWMAEVKEELSKPQTPSLADLLIAYYNPVSYTHLLYRSTDTQTVCGWSFFIL